MAIAFVSSVGRSDNGTTSAIDTTGATLLVACVADENGDTTVSDSKGNTWVLAVGTSGNARTESIIYYVKNPSVGTGHTFTVSGSGNSPNSDFMAFSGTDTTANVDQTNSAAASSALNIQPGSITPSTDNQLVVSGYGHDNGTVSSVTGYTIDRTDAGAGGVAWGGSAAYQIQTTATATNPTWTTGASSSNAATIASFKEGGGGPAPAVKDIIGGGIIPFAR